MQVEKEAQIQYYRALLDGRYATADFLEQKDPKLAQVRPPWNMRVSVDRDKWHRIGVEGEIKEAK